MVRNPSIDEYDPSAWGVAAHATITVSDAISANKIHVPTRQHVFKAVVYVDVRSKCYCAMAEQPALQMTGIDAYDALSALSDALESLMIDNNYDAAFLERKYPRTRTGWETEQMFDQLTRHKQPLVFMRVK